MKSTVFVFLLLILINSSFGQIGERFWKIRNAVERQRQQSVNEAMGWPYADIILNTVETFFIDQPMDHFNGLSKDLGKTFKQRYYVNQLYWTSKEHSPVFLYIGGEGTLNSKGIAAGEIVDLAKHFGALLVSAEHRFYGASLNSDGLQLGELQYLSSQQALADLATLIPHIQEKFGVPTTVKWVSFGGSYSGALSAWFRLKYPHLVHAALASSAPVQAVTDFEGYNRVIGASLSDTIVGGSQKCLDMVITAFSKVDSLIAEGEFSQLQGDFVSCGPISERMDSVTFVSNLGGGIQGIVQYNNEIPGKNISFVCEVMTKTEDAYSNLRALNKEMMEMENETCVDNSYMNYTRKMMNTTVDTEAKGPGMRQWIYQTCTQFGYYQTCDSNTTCPFSHLLSLADSDLKVCQNVFKMDPEDVHKNVQFTNSYYGGKRTQQSRIIFANGSIDPWHWLSILTNQTTYGDYAVFIQGTAHCADLIPAKATDPPTLQSAREEIKSLLGQMLQQPSVYVS